MAPTSPRHRVLIICRCKCYRNDRVRATSGPEEEASTLLYRARGSVYRRVVARRIPRALGAVVVLALALLALVAPNAAAQATCLFDEMTGVLQVTLVGGAPAVLARETDTITLDGVACGTATVANTDTILVGGTGLGQPDDLTLDLAGGPFAPGLSAETDGGDPEIEISVDLLGGGDLRVSGSDGNQQITLGSAGANLNADEAVGDTDVTLTGPAAWSVDGRAGDDRISLAGGAGTGEAVAAVSVHGGVGDDTIVGMIGGSTIDGGEGSDTSDYSPASQVRRRPFGGHRSSERGPRGRVGLDRERRRHPGGRSAERGRRGEHPLGR